jgi:CheY-like chemotaxis protein
MTEELEGKTNPGENLRVLIADDSLIQRKLLERRLLRLGFQVIAAEDGQQALELARESAPHAVITDIVMPAMDGFALCRAIRTDPQLRTIPVLVTSTTDHDERERQMAAEAGATAFIKRTPTFQEVIAVLLELLGLEGR